MVRALGKSGIPVAVATSDMSDKSARSRYCKEVVEIPGWSRDSAATLSALLRWAKEQDSKPVLFYQTDADLVWIARFRDQLSKVFRFVFPDCELVEDLVDKSRFYERAVAWGIPIPETQIVNDTRDNKKQSDEWTSFPCILKPITRSEAWRDTASKEQKALHIESKEELDVILDRFKPELGPLVLQSIIRGGEENILSYHAYVGEDQEVLMEFTGGKIRTSPRQYGFSTYLEITENEEVRDLGRDIVNKLDFHGVLKIDFKRDDPSGKLYVLEINPRFNLWHHPGTVAGSPIPEAVYWSCVDPTKVNKLAKARKGVRWMRPRCDIRSFGEYHAKDRLSAAQWLYQAITVEVNEGFQFSDLGPAVYDVLEIFRGLYHSSWRASDKSCKSH
jgi:predicted ATP-grasp superfamily ATP-dependent carboligase